MQQVDTSDLRESALPGTWAWCRVGDIARVGLGGTPSRKVAEHWGGNIPWVSSGEVANCRISATRESITSAGLKNSNAKLYPAGTVLIAMIGEGKTLGQTSVLDIAACTNQNVAALAFEPETICAEYVWYWALSRYESNRSAGQGGNYPALNGEKVRNLPVPVPSLLEQQEIVRHVIALFATAKLIEDRLSGAYECCENLPGAVMANAFRGTLVPTAGILSL